LCDPEAATANSPWELTVGSSSKEKPTLTRGVTVPTRSILEAVQNIPHDFILPDQQFILLHPFS
jgi:hypothetical protein